MSFFQGLKLVSSEVGANYDRKDAWIAFKSIFPKKHTKSKIWSENWFRDFLSLEKTEPLFFVDNGRTGLYLILKSLGLPRDSEILIQPFSCVVIPNSIWQAGYKPVLVDVDPENFNLDLDDLQKKINSKTKAIVVQYTFGLTPNMDKLLEICRKNNLILVEDCAHSLAQEVQIGSKSHKLGTIGQASFFSFGRDKVVSTTQGGLVTIPQNPVYKLPKFDSQKLQQKIATEFTDLPEMPFKYLFTGFLYTILTVLIIRPFYHLGLGKFTVGKMTLYLSRKFGVIGEIYTPEEKVGTDKMLTAKKYPDRFFSLLQNQLQKLESFQNHRRSLVEFYAKSFGVKNYPKTALIRFPLDLSKISPDYTGLFDKLNTELKNNGVMMGKWYTSFFFQDDLDIPQKFGWKTGDLPNAEKLINKRIINLPTNTNCTQKDAERIVRVIQKIL